MATIPRDLSPDEQRLMQKFLKTVGDKTAADIMTTPPFPEIGETVVVDPSKINMVRDRFGLDEDQENAILNGHEFEVEYIATEYIILDSNELGLLVPLGTVLGVKDCDREKTTEYDTEWEFYDREFQRVSIFDALRYAERTLRYEVDMSENEFCDLLEHISNGLQRGTIEVLDNNERIYLALRDNVPHLIYREKMI